MKRVIIYLIFVVSACNSNDASRQKEEIKSKKSQKSIIPIEVETYIKSKLSGWFLAPSETWDDTSFRKYYSDTSQINYISEDFNCDGKIDYSLILKDSSDNVSIIEITSFDGHYYHQELERLNNYRHKKLDFGLQKIPPGPIHHPSGPPPTLVPCGAIQKFFTNRDSKKIFYYDDDGKQVVLQFGE